MLLLDDASRSVFVTERRGAFCVCVCVCVWRRSYCEGPGFDVSQGTGCPAGTSL